MSEFSNHIGKTQAGGILVLQAGPSTLDFTLFAVDSERALSRAIDGRLERLHADARFHARDAAGRTVIDVDCADENPPGHRIAVELLLNWLKQHAAAMPLVAVGHDVVHGGPRFSGPVRIDAPVIHYLQTLVPLAPERQRPCVLPIRVIARRWPRLPQVACFETAFYHDLPPPDVALPSPPGKRGSRRDGYDGLAFECAIGMLPTLDERTARGKTIVVHIGDGASLCALDAGRRMTTATGLGELVGLSGRRMRRLDQGVVPHLMAQLRMSAEQVESALRQQSEGLGASGLADHLDRLVRNTEPRARVAVELLVYGISRELGSLAAALAGLDAIVFTAGAGPHAAPIRAQICRRASWLGVDLDPAANQAGGPRLTQPGSRVTAWAIPIDTRLFIARHTRVLSAERLPCREADSVRL